MASGLSFFHSSPPQPTSNPWQQRATSAYYTPQQPSKLPWSNAFAPPSPSPLRTSRNANLMSGVLQSGEVFSKHAEGDGRDENANASVNAHVLGGERHDGGFLPAATASTNLSNSTSLGFTSPWSTVPSDTTTPTTSPSFSFGAPALPTDPFLPPPASFTLDDKPTFQFSARARSSSPSVQLQTHTQSNRDSRKRLFLDRLRSRRDDTRSDRLSDQVLRMDFMRERRRWEAEMEGWEGDVQVDANGDVEVDVMSDHVEEDEEMGPVDEREIEDLIEGYFDVDEAQRRRDNDGDGDEEFSDDGYEEAFQQVLSQEVPVWSWDTSGSGSGKGSKNENESNGRAQSDSFGPTPSASLAYEQGSGPADSAMDMS